MRKSIAILSLLVMAMLTPLSHAESPIAKYFGSVDGTRVIVPDSLGARLDSLDTTWRLWSRINGSEKDATFGWFSDKNTGLFRFGENRMGFTTGGTSRAIVDSNGVSVFPGLRLAPSQYSTYTDSVLTLALSSGNPLFSFFASNGVTATFGIGTTGELAVSKSFKVTGDTLRLGATGEIDLAAANILHTADKLQQGSTAADSGLTAESGHFTGGLLIDKMLNVGTNIAVGGVTAWVDSNYVQNNGIAIGDIAALQDRLDEKQTSITLQRFLLPADVDTTVAGEAGNNVEVSRDVFATVHPDSGQVIRFMPEDASADPDTISAVVFDQVFDPGDSLIFYADADTAGQKVTVTITGADGTVILNQTATSADDQGYVRYAYAAAATVTQQEYRIVYKFIGYLSHWMKVSRVTVKRAG